MSEVKSRSLRILFTNNTLAAKAGSELYIRDLAIELMKRGHRPVAYSSVHGLVAQELRTATIPVIDDLAALGEAPDLIHGQHHMDAMAAMLRFPHTPAVYVCHGWAPWEEQPPRFPSIGRYVAVDDLCRERLLSTPGIGSADIDTIYNFVDLELFQARVALPDKPGKALVFSNYAGDSPQLAAIRSACARFGIAQVDVAGVASGNPILHPEKTLPEYDLVFAKARCALEAMAVGCAVIVTDYAGLAGLVTTQNMQRLRELNFGVRSMQQARVSEDSVFAALTQYDAADAQQVSQWIRQHAGLRSAADQWEALYWRVIDFSIAPPAPDALLGAAADYLCSLHEPLKRRMEAEASAARAKAELQTSLLQQEELQRQLTEQCEASIAQQARMAEMQSQTQSQQQRYVELISRLDADEKDRQQRFVVQQDQANELKELNEQVATCQAQLKEIHSSKAWKAIGLYRKLHICLPWR